MKITGTLEDWVVQWHRKIDKYVIWGDIYEDIHERWHEGYRIHTSAIRKDRYPPAELKEGMVIETLYSSYYLGKQRHD